MCAAAHDAIPSAEEALQFGQNLKYFQEIDIFAKKYQYFS